jgi:hypothetical protein
VKILFFMRSTIYVRNFESTLRLLAERGHDVQIVAEPHLEESNDLVARLNREHPRITHTRPPLFPFSAWSYLGRELRRGIDYLRYLGPEYAGAPKLRGRAERTAPDFVVAALERPLMDTPAGHAVLATVLRWCDRAIPRQPAIDAFIAENAPDLVLVTPLVEPGSPQAEYLRSARAAGVRTGLCVYSWDNLTNKGLIHDPLDVVTVWNEPMKREAIELHRVPAERVVVTGAAAYDHWFSWQPRSTREEFCARVGLRAGRPYLLYLCSSRFIAPNEVDFIRRWVTELRAGSPILRDVGVLVRPHPQNTDQWETADLSDLEQVTVWPRAGANPVDVDSRAEYYDSIYHSAAVVGVNTSAQIESAIVGRGVYTVLAPEFRDTQAGTLHFQHLRYENGGLLNVAEDFPEHIAQLERAVQGSHDAERCRRFVEAFVRPHGTGVASAPQLAAALEQTAARGPRPPDRGPWWAPALRPLLRRGAERLAHTEKARKEKTSRHERARERQEHERSERRAALVASKLRAQAEREQSKQQELARREAERHAREAFEARAIENYRVVREWARRVRDGNGTEHVALTEAEQQVLHALAPLWDAPRETVIALRHACEPVTGVVASHYDLASREMVPGLKRRAGFLRKQVGSELFVYEPALLGGFGIKEHAGLYNEDTVRHFNVLVALRDAAVLPEYRNGNQRRIVWEIGGGWGGFAYQFKQLCPNVTYVITGAPEMFLLSAVYLTTLFPDARFRFYGASPHDELWNGWESVDFVFVPEGALASLRPPHVDLTLDLGALSMMGCPRTCAHMQRAYDLESRFFYSLIPGQATDDSPVVKAMARLYWPHPVPPRRDPRDGSTEPYRHVVGWRRIRV